MTKKEAIKIIYKVLLLYEDVLDENSNVKEEDYLSYLERIYIRFLSKKSEISDTLYGLKTIGFKCPHKRVKSIVFHLIGLIEKEGVDENVF